MAEPLREKPTVLFQFDADGQPSSFDQVVAVDAGAERIFPFAGVAPEDVEGIVHGAIFTRGPKDLRRTALFIGGRNVAKAEELHAAALKAFVGPLRCSVLMDASGCNTTAAAALIAATQHLDLSRTTALVLGGTGPVGQRVARLLARQKASVFVGSRGRDRAADVCQEIAAKTAWDKVFPLSMSDGDALAGHPERFHLIVAAGAAGARLLSRESVRTQENLRVLIDLNAVPPSGIEGVEAMDFGREYLGAVQFGALGVGRLKMKIHRAAIQQLFAANDQNLDAEEILALAQRLSFD